jgi:hypothetical protein
VTAIYASLDAGVRLPVVAIHVPNWMATMPHPDALENFAPFRPE